MEAKWVVIPAGVEAEMYLAEDLYASVDIDLKELADYFDKLTLPEFQDNETVQQIWREARVLLAILHDNESLNGCLGTGEYETLVEECRNLAEEVEEEGSEAVTKFWTKE